MSIGTVRCLGCKFHRGTDHSAQLPQLITNYKNQNADALSMGFLVIWLLGDLTNLAGVYS